MPLSTAQWMFWLGAAIVYGLCIGSFLNVVIYRMPRGQSVSSPTWSYCPACKHRLSLADLVPLLSFLFLGRRCRYCRAPISWRYFGVEALTGVLFALVFLHAGPTVDCVFDALFVSILIPAFFIDIEQFIIPDELCVLGFILGIAYNIYGIALHRAGMWWQFGAAHLLIPASICSAVACALIFHMISFIGLLYYSGVGRGGTRKVSSAVWGYWLGVLDDYAYLLLKYLGFGLWLAPARRFIAEREAAIAEELIPASVAGHAPRTASEIAAEIEADEEQTGMGQGDAKLAGAIGSFLLLPLSLISFFLAVAAGAVVGVGLMISQGRGGRTAIPFGPYLVVGAVVSLLVGAGIERWYAHYAFPAALVAH